ncbi:MAG TPA: SpoIID/LytB domain-containing protein, partial [Bacteroidales bacterium]|nr:SpoIID/LytB domain-containing protein [Bacteroidales bacterium]
NTWTCRRLGKDCIGNDQRTPEKSSKLRNIALFFILLIDFPLTGQVSIRIFADSKPSSVIFTVTSGQYVFDTFDGATLLLKKNDQVLLSPYNGRLAVKSVQHPAFVTDSVLLSANSADCSFSVTLNGANTTRQSYNGNLKCRPDLGTIVMVNICNEKEYLAGVVLTEGGSGKNIEFFKTQAVIARTYMYKYPDKHSNDGYNLCDNTHCQAFKGLTHDTLIKKAVLETNGLVILDKDSVLIISAFHSNCGGETASPEDVWLTKVPYLRKVTDPYCLSSRNAKWEKKVPVTEWNTAIKKLADTDTLPALSPFIQNSRAAMYKIGSINIPLRDIRGALGLRSTFFSMTPAAENIVLTGRGYGHGVGLCQEGAMNMAARGFSFAEILSFYYSDVRVLNIYYARPAEKVK